MQRENTGLARRCNSRCSGATFTQSMHTGVHRGASRGAHPHDRTTGYGVRGTAEKRGGGGGGNGDGRAECINAA